MHPSPVWFAIKVELGPNVSTIRGTEARPATGGARRTVLVLEGVAVAGGLNLAQNTLTELMPCFGCWAQQSDEQDIQNEF